MEWSHGQVRECRAGADISIWKEALFGADLLLLHASPAFYGLGIPRGDDSAVILIPGFLSSDSDLAHLYSWLGHMGYRPYYSGIGVNVECPNLLIKRRLIPTIKKAATATRRKIHLIGHSLGGVIARSVAAQRPEDIASVITLGSPFRGAVVHRSVFRAVENVRDHILKENGRRVPAGCYTPHCNCEFRKCLGRKLPASIRQTAIYTCDDGIVDWHYCRTGNPDIDRQVPGTHLGLPVNASVYNIIAQRLAEPRPQRSTRCRAQASRRQLPIQRLTADSLQLTANQEPCALQEKLSQAQASQHDLPIQRLTADSSQLTASQRNSALQETSSHPVDENGHANPERHAWGNTSKLHSLVELVTFASAHSPRLWSNRKGGLRRASSSALAAVKAVFSCSSSAMPKKSDSHQLG